MTMSASLKRTILVTGATGQQGGHVARSLLENGHVVRALTRNPESQGAKGLREMGAEIHQGSFDDPTSMVKAARGADAVFAMGTPYESGAETETKQSIALLDAMGAAGVGHIVYTSVADADKGTGVPHFDSKHAVEEHLREMGTPYTILGPVWFMENVLGPWFLPELQQGRLSLALPAGRAVQQISLGNIADVASTVIEGGSAFHGRRIDIAGDEVSGEQMIEIISRLSGRKLEYVQVPLEALREMNEDWAKMFEWFDKVGYDADIPSLRQEFPGIHWQTFEEWASDQEWIR
jgi:uncharacterized protein YbjT (DUF2867 family)